MEKRRSFVVGLMLVFVAAACVDRITFNTGDPGAYPVVVEGFITDQPGPYLIRVSKTFDIESKLSLKTPVNVRKLSISDDAGNSEELIQVDDGFYQTHPGGIQGVVGRSYRIRVELLDGRIYESVPDKMYPTGSVDKIYHRFVSGTSPDNTPAYAFDLFFDAKAASSQNFWYMWKVVGTYQFETNPELVTVPCGEARCPAPLSCSAYAVGPDGPRIVRDCTCCTCWAELNNAIPVVSDDQLVQGGKFTGVAAGQIPVTAWTFMNKTHVEIQQFSLSPTAYEFWKGIKAQKEGVISLFQPITGKIPGNFEQVSGTPGLLEGFFYASSVSKKSIFITRSDLPSTNVIPAGQPFAGACTSFTPGATTVRPDFWN